MDSIIDNLTGKMIEFGDKLPKSRFNKTSDHFGMKNLPSCKEKRLNVIGYGKVVVVSGIMTTKFGLTTKMPKRNFGLKLSMKENKLRIYLSVLSLTGISSGRKSKTQETRNHVAPLLSVTRRVMFYMRHKMS